MSQEYVAAIALLVGGILKIFNIEIPNDTIEGIVFGALALWIAIRRKKRGDITLLGVRKPV